MNVRHVFFLFKFLWTRETLLPSVDSADNPLHILCATERESRGPLLFLGFDEKVQCKCSCRIAVVREGGVVVATNPLRPGDETKVGTALGRTRSFRGPMVSAPLLPWCLPVQRTRSLGRVVHLTSVVQTPLTNYMEFKGLVWFLRKLEEWVSL